MGFNISDVRTNKDGLRDTLLEMGVVEQFGDYFQGTGEKLRNLQEGRSMMLGDVATGASNEARTLLDSYVYFGGQESLLTNIADPISIADAQYFIASMSIKDDSLKKTKVKITKLAQGLPVGGEIESLDDGTLFSAFKNRANLNSNSD